MTKSKGIQKIMAGVTAVMLAIMLLGGCQPTPEQAVVVNKRDGIPSDALKETAQTDADGQAAHYEPASYSVSEHWSDQIEKNEYYKFDIDVDVMTPDVDAYPVQKLERLNMTQERADKMIAYFAGEGAQFYKWPVPMTKDYYEAQIIELKKSLAEVEAGGDGETPESLRSYIQEAEEKLAAAPQQTELELTTDTNFTYQNDWETGEVLEQYGPNYINLGMDADDGGIATINISRFEEGNLNSTYTGFSYNACIFESEDMYIDTEKWLAEDEKRVQLIDEQYRAEEQKYIDEQKERIETFKARIAQNKVDLDAMQQKTVQILEDLDIEGVQITSVNRALIGPQTKDQWSSYTYQYTPPDQDGCYIQFIRECGGIPCTLNSGGSVPDRDDLAEGMYSAPFDWETGSIVLDAQGNVRAFWWNSAAQVLEQVAGDSELLPFEQIKQRAVDQIYWNNTFYFDSETMPEDYHIKYRFVIDDVKLCMAYTSAKDDPDRAMMVPAWYVGAQAYITYPEGDSIYGNEESMGNYDSVLINALDGSRILMPGLETFWAQDEMLQQEMEEEEGGAA